MLGLPEEAAISTKAPDSLKSLFMIYCTGD